LLKPLRKNFDINAPITLRGDERSLFCLDKEALVNDEVK
jgi:hypothetical protein